MCEPVSIGMAIVAVASAAMQAKSQREQGKFQHGTAKYNARVAENEAVETANVGTEEEMKHRRATAELLSKQRAKLGAAGVSLGSGSALQLQEDTQTLGEVDALRIRSNFRSQAAALETGAELTRAEGKFAESAGKKAAIGTLFSTAGGVAGTGVADKWMTPSSSARAGAGSAASRRTSIR
jgi:hypothetical protein